MAGETLLLSLSNTIELGRDPAAAGRSRVSPCRHADLSDGASGVSDDEAEVGHAQTPLRSPVS